MSDTPMLELLAYVMRDPEWAASEITILQRELAAAAERIADLERERRALQILIAEQAKDEGLWFVAQTAPEAYLQVELRLLHAAIDAARKELPNAP